MQLTGLAQDTLARSLSLVPGLGVFSTRHRVPFQVTASVWPRPSLPG